MIFNTQLSKIVVHKKEIESKLCCLWKSLFKRLFQLQYIEACLQMLTAVLSSFYNQDMKVGSVDPRQMRMATAFVKSSGFNISFFLSCTFQEVIHKQFVSLSLLQPPQNSLSLHSLNRSWWKSSSCSLGLLWLWGSWLQEMPQCRATATSLCMWGGSQPTRSLSI